MGIIELNGNVLEWVCSDLMSGSSVLAKFYSGGAENLPPLKTRNRGVEER